MKKLALKFVEKVPWESYFFLRDKREERMDKEERSWCQWLQTQKINFFFCAKTKDKALGLGIKNISQLPRIGGE